MTDARPAPRIAARSMGLKLLLVCGLALVMSIVALFVFILLMERSSRAKQVATEVGQVMGGPQTFLGPIVAVPYVIPPQGEEKSATAGTYVFFPVTAAADVQAASEVRKRSLFKVPVYRAVLDMKAEFDLSTPPADLPTRAVLDWTRSSFLVGVSDPRGAKADVVLQAAGKSLPLAPAGGFFGRSPPGPEGVKSGGGPLVYFGASAAGVAGPGAKFSASTRLQFTGAERLAVLPYGKATQLRVRSDWPHPSFDGGFLPVDKIHPGERFQRPLERALHRPRRGR